jgi:hypothetical protein
VAPGQLQQKLLQLQAAASFADEASALMSMQPQHLANALNDMLKGKNGGCSQQQQQQHARDCCSAVQLLQRATGIREQHLHKMNQLLGLSHHQTASAAIQATARKVITASATNWDAVLPALLLSVEMLEAVEEKDVLRVLDELQDELLALCTTAAPCGCHDWGLSSLHSSDAAASTTPRGSCNLSNTSCCCQQVQSVAATEAAIIGSSSNNNFLLSELQQLLEVAAQHLNRSVEVLSAQLPSDALPLAIERLSAAATLCCLSCTRAVQAGWRVRASQDPAEVPSNQACSGAPMSINAQVSQQQQQHWCCACSNMLNMALMLHRSAAAVIQLHIGQ